MKTNVFKVTYANGAVQETNSDAESVEAFCNSHFGSTWPEAQGNGAKVELLSEFVPVPEAAPASADDAERHDAPVETPADEVASDKPADEAPVVIETTDNVLSDPAGTPNEERVPAPGADKPAETSLD